jgi:DNA-binding MarR family transcriptional regulator
VAPRKQPKDAALGTAFEFFNEIGIIAQLSSNQMERTLPHQLTQSQFSVLNWFVRVDDQATPGRLASAFQVTRGAMTNTLGKLEAKGFVKVEPDPTSGRSKRVTMTKAGRQARDEAIRAAHGPLSEFLEHYPPSVLQKALPLLKDIRAYLDDARN